MTRSPLPVAIGVVASVRRRRFQHPATGSHTYSSSVSPSRRGPNPAPPRPPPPSPALRVPSKAIGASAEGVGARPGVAGLASRLGYSPRQIERHLVAEVGAGPLAIARAQRAQTARLLAETTDLPLSHVAFAAGFKSVRQFNDTV